jgi:hypothetical protein
VIGALYGVPDDDDVCAGNTRAGSRSTLGEMRSLVDRLDAADRLRLAPLAVEPKAPRW